MWPGKPGGSGPLRQRVVPCVFGTRPTVTIVRSFGTTETSGSLAFLVLAHTSTKHSPRTCARFVSSSRCAGAAGLVTNSASSRSSDLRLVLDQAISSSRRVAPSLEPKWLRVQRAPQRKRVAQAQLPPRHVASRGPTNEPTCASVEPFTVAT